MREIEIRKLEIDIEKKILKINGKPFTEKAIIVNLPGTDGWPLSFLVNEQLASGVPEECAKLTVNFTEKPETWSPEVTRRKIKAWDKKITQILLIIFLSMIVSIMVVRLTRG